MMNQELITVIVPIYNVEKYLSECINSIIKQTYTNIEIILVNDGSTDNSPNICIQFKEKDNRIRLINKENGGLSSARNAGIDIAKGKYLVFIDSDDYVDKKYIERLYNSVIINKTKVAQCGIWKVNDEKEKIGKIGYSRNVIKNGKEMIKDIYANHWLENIVVWNKIYETSIFKDIRFPLGKINEDEFTTYKILYSETKIPIINDDLYFYRQSNNSLMRKKFNIKRLDLLEGLEERIEFFSKNGDIELYNMTIKAYLNKCIESYMNVRIYIENSKDTQKMIKRKYFKYSKKILKNSLTIKEKIKILFFKFLPNYYYYLKKCKYIN